MRMVIADVDDSFAEPYGSLVQWPPLSMENNGLILDAGPFPF